MAVTSVSFCSRGCHGPRVVRGGVLRVVAWSGALMAALVLLVLGLWFEHDATFDLGSDQGRVQPHAIPPVDALDHAFEPGRLSLVDESGDVRIDDLPPAWRWVYFGYTACPDICPGSLAILAMALREALADDALRRQMTRSGAVHDAPVEALFLSVDAERDSPQTVGEYAKYFHSAIRGGVLPETSAAYARSAFGVVFDRVELEGSAMGYVIDHSSMVYLLDPESRVVVVHDHGEGPGELVEALRTAVATAAISTDTGVVDESVRESGEPQGERPSDVSFRGPVGESAQDSEQGPGQASDDANGRSERVDSWQD